MNNFENMNGANYQNEPNIVYLNNNENIPKKNILMMLR